MTHHIIAALIALVTPHHKQPPVHYSKATCYDLRGITASGKPVGPGVAAHNFLPSGTKFRIVGRQPGPHGRRRYIVRDTGPALRDGHFDLWGGYGCAQFGVRTIAWRYGW